MKNSTKAAIATGAAAVLLLGGAGTLAYWTDEGTVSAGTITAGNIHLQNLQCPSAWTYADADQELPAGTVTKVVPGDTIEKECTATVIGEGDHLFADIDLDQDSVDAVAAALGTDELTVTAAQTAPSGGHVPISSTPTDVAFTITVVYPHGAENNDSQGQTTAPLAGLKVTLVQVHI
jgi:alternate signal-mediated exported protein